MMNEDSDADSDFDAALAIDDTSSNTDAEEFELHMVIKPS